MLNHAKLMRELQQVRAKLFVDNTEAVSYIQKLWQRIVDDESLVQQVASQLLAIDIPRWQGVLGATYPVRAMQQPYILAAVDGSQIYPDRHQGTSCFLLNIGSVLISYGISGGPVFFDSSPSVIVDDDLPFEHAVELVNCKRQELELQQGVILCKATVVPDVPFLFFFDGSLIFWHLYAKEGALKNYFLGRYKTVLEEFYQERVYIAGYISLPKSKELMSMVKGVASIIDRAHYDESLFNHVVDTTLMRFLLQPHERSTVFEHTGPLVQHYPPFMRPCFFYMHGGFELVRIEIPFWLAQDPALVDLVASIALDQLQKGFGYPVALAEAHEQAVVKGPDREFFYQLLQKFYMEEKRTIVPSQKSMKKRKIGI